MPDDHKPHSKLPTVAECDERIIEAQYVVDHPDDYDVEVRVQAAKDANRWTFNRRFARRVAELEEQLEATEQRLAREISEHADAQAEAEKWHREALDWQQAKSEADSAWADLQEQLEAAQEQLAAPRDVTALRVGIDWHSHDGMVTVYDRDGRYMGCMGVERFHRLLAEDAISRGSNPASSRPAFLERPVGEYPPVMDDLRDEPDPAKERP